MIKANDTSTSSINGRGNAEMKALGLDTDDLVRAKLPWGDQPGTGNPAPEPSGPTSAGKKALGLDSDDLVRTSLPWSDQPGAGNPSGPTPAGIEVQSELVETQRTLIKSQKEALQAARNEVERLAVGGPIAERRTRPSRRRSRSLARGRDGGGHEPNLPTPE